MKRDITTSALALLLFTVLLGLGYPALVTGIAHVAMPGRAGGSLVERDGEVVGSRLLAQAIDAEEYFHPRPSQTGYAADASAFLNLGPNQRELADLFAERRDAVLELEGPFHDGLGARDLPVDAVTNSGSGLDPHISRSNAELQAPRIAAARDADLDDVLDLVEEHVDGRAFGLFGEPGVNVLELDLALDRKLPLR